MAKLYVVKVTSIEAHPAQNTVGVVFSNDGGALLFDDNDQPFQGYGGFLVTLAEDVRENAAQRAIEDAGIADAFDRGINLTRDDVFVYVRFGRQ